MNNETVKFTTFFEGWSPAYESHPIKNPEGVLVGAFTVIDGPVWKCFIASRGYAESLALRTESKLYITPKRADDGSISELTLSLWKENDESKEVQPES